MNFTIYQKIQINTAASIFFIKNTFRKLGKQGGSFRRTLLKLVPIRFDQIAKDKDYIDIESINGLPKVMHCNPEN
ncbi:MAG: hypothetical protein PUP91_34815 [Rhizonema sp. PD37]|nr:hypothetical protein [Rhizonema sp. PD37]